MQVVLGLAQSLHDLWINVVLNVSLCRIVQFLPLVSISVLLALPHLGALLGRHFKDSWVKRLNDWVAHPG